MIARALLSVLDDLGDRNRHRLRTDGEGRRRMSEQWRGHYARCLECENLCASGEPCRCCLAAEVEVLRAQVERVRDGVNVVLQRAQGVREFGGRSLDWVSGAEHAAKVITDALDGDDE